MWESRDAAPSLRSHWQPSRAEPKDVALPWLSRSGVGRAVPGRRGGTVLVGAICRVEWGCFPSASTVSGNMHMAQPVLAFSWATSAAHWSPCCVSSPQAPRACGGL